MPYEVRLTFYFSTSKAPITKVLKPHEYCLKYDKKVWYDKNYQTYQFKFITNDFTPTLDYFDAWDLELVYLNKKGNRHQADYPCPFT